MTLPRLNPKNLVGQLFQMGIQEYETKTVIPNGHPGILGKIKTNVKTHVGFESRVSSKLLRVAAFEFQYLFKK